MAENLNYEAKGSKCYNDSTTYCDKYGRLYDWETAMKVCPKGWHLPDKEEWDVLAAEVGGEKIAGKYLKAANGWQLNGNGKDKYGFSALPGGSYVYGVYAIDGYFPGDFFFGAGASGYWWGSNEGYNLNAYNRIIEYHNEDATWYYGYKYTFISIRCLHDSIHPREPSNDKSKKKGTFITDTRDGKKYKTVKIGKQVWMAENLNYEADGSKCYKDSTAYCDKYGRLYDWETAMKVCPKGWHLPTRANFETLMKTVDDSPKFLKTTRGWDNGRISGNGIDIYGFSALPGGYGYGGFRGVGEDGYWWHTSANDEFASYFRIDMNDKYSLNSGSKKIAKLGVRCLQNTPAPPKGEAK